MYGACVGYPLEAVRGAISQKGSVVGISPALNREEHIHDFAYTPGDKEIIIYSGLGKHARDVVFIRSTDAVIFIGGAEGSLLEFCVAYGNNKVIGILLGSGGIADQLEAITDAFYHKPGVNPVIVKSSDPYELVMLVASELKKQDEQQTY
jgi:uncharacterized protein (TIGR00725 family)